MKQVVDSEMLNMFLQPGLGFLTVTLTASTCKSHISKVPPSAQTWARQMGKAKLSLSGGVHMTLVASPWL